jgi:hypothetical protein
MPTFREWLDDNFDGILLPSPKILQPWEQEYFRHLEAEWKVLNVEANPQINATPSGAADVKRIADLVIRFNDPTLRPRVNRNDLLSFELTVFRYRSVVSLVQVAPMLRQRFHDVVGDRVFATYRPTELPDCTKATEAARTTLFDDLGSLISAIHWRYILFPFSSQLRTVLTTQALLFMLLYTVFWAIMVYYATQWTQGAFIALLGTCVYAGVVGGFISALRRMQSISDDGDPIYVIQGIRSARFWLLFSPLLGGIFAVVALLFFVSGSLSGSIFPAFHMPGDLPCALNLPAGTACDPAFMKPQWWFWQRLLPIAPMDYAKLFLWCFISGFAERFIPDMIDTLVDRADAPKSNTGSGTPVLVQPGGGPGGGPPPPGPGAPPTKEAAPLADGQAVDKSTKPDAPPAEQKLGEADTKPDGKPEAQPEDKQDAKPDGKPEDKQDAKPEAGEAQADA